MTAVQVLTEAAALIRRSRRGFLAAWTIGATFAVVIMAALTHIPLPMVLLLAAVGATVGVAVSVTREAATNLRRRTR